MPFSRDTTAEAQVALLRSKTVAERISTCFVTSEVARSTALAGIRHRHPEYDDATAQLALFGLLVGDDRFVRAWPTSPLREP